MQGEAKEEVRAKLNIEDVIGEYVELKRAGRNFKGLSPFTSEKTPSFVVSPDKQIWHDFSSNRGGDLFGFVMEVEIVAGLDVEFVGFVRVFGFEFLDDRNFFVQVSHGARSLRKWLWIKCFLQVYHNMLYPHLHPITRDG